MTLHQRALELFDSLEPVDIEFMIGRWKGDGYPTDHPLDGLLEVFHWYGKHFESGEDVHPLLFSNRRGKLVRVNPGYMKPSFALAEHMSKFKSRTAGNIFQLLLPLFSTSKSRARLRMTEYRGKVSATMIYDQLPINDVFRKLDDDAVLGVMDNKIVKDPFFFKLTRDSSG
ncbi:MAG: DUF4334 domain-containing protein [Woeseiaceae bacterium]|nr:DUF4334 domain-containing protein [Woeseiaceae bacterium]NIP22108.1 DUF4334 domain-containing protein [Woeseiaceae bacterium]NIS91231.1 DUF4334 domain-containing protein [Woeseiaceae bacterium]